MTAVELGALDGTNPLGFLAALGTLSVCDRAWPDRDVRLSWTERVVPTPRLHGAADVPEIVAAVMADRDGWRPSVAMDWPAEESPWGDVKADEAAIRAWLEAAQDASATDGGRALSLVTALVAEVSRDRSGKAKPSDLHFTAGRQQFLTMARELRDHLVAEQLTEALAGPWRYEADAPSLMWDVTDDRVYALSATNPATDKKRTVPGAEWLALMGITCLPVVGTRGRTLTPGCVGEWHRGGAFTWPLWDTPVSADVARSLLTLPGLLEERPSSSLRARGIIRVCRSGITRSAQGGYGAFRPVDHVLDVIGTAP